MTTLLPGPYGRHRDTTMTFPDRLAKRGSDRYNGVLMEDELCGPGGISAHFWVYPAAPAERLRGAVVNCASRRDVIRWQWDFIPRKHLPQVLHYHLREVLMRGTKSSSYLYLFLPEDVLMLGEIYDAYKSVWHQMAASPSRDGELLSHPRSFAQKQLEKREKNKEVEIVNGKEFVRCPMPSTSYLVDVQAKELTWLLNISNDVQSATAETGMVVRKRADLSEDNRHVL